MKFEEGKTEKFTHAGHEYAYKVEKYTLYKDYWSLIIVGGPYNYRATTTCRYALLKDKLKALILMLKQR